MHDGAPHKCSLAYVSPSNTISSGDAFTVSTYCAWLIAALIVVPEVFIAPLENEDDGDSEKELISRMGEISGRSFKDP